MTWLPKGSAQQDPSLLKNRGQHCPHKTMRATQPSRAAGASTPRADAMVQNQATKEAANFAGFTQTETPLIVRPSIIAAIRQNTTMISITQPRRARIGWR
jgi:hypothetical protein